MQPGDLLYTRSAGPVGWLIRFGQNVRYHGWIQAVRRGVSGRTDPADWTWGNHIAVCAGDHVIEALARGLTRSPLTKYGIADSTVLPLTAVCPDVTDTERGRVVAFAEHELAAKDSYSWLGIASIVLQLLTPTRLDVSVDGAMICSAFGARCWEHAGVTLQTRSPYTTMPADLRALVHLNDPKEFP